jgi:hypothetical protein
LQNQAYKKSGSAAVRQSLDSHATGDLASANQWPKNSHSRMITGIGTPSNHNRIPRPIISSSKYIEEKTRDVAASSCAEKNLPRRNVYDFGISRERQSDPKQRVAVAVDRLAHLGIDVVSMAAARQPPFAFQSCRWETARPRVSPAGSPDDGRARRSWTMPTSGRCSASRSTAPPAASVRPSATVRSNADPVSARRPCCRRAAAG